MEAARKTMTPEIASSLQAAANAYQSGLENGFSGKTRQARAAFVEAAGHLLSAAELSGPALRRSRMDMAARLLEFAATLEKAPAPGSRPAADRQTQESGEPESGLVSEKPETRFADVAGLEDVKEQIRLKLIYPYSFPEKAARYGIQPGGGILLYGPPGTGKTMIARAVAGEIDAAFFAIKPSSVMSEWVGVAERNIARLFADTANHPLSVIFIDEIEALTPKRRGSGSTVMVRVVPQILAELDGFKKRANPLLFIGATNEPWAIDAAILRPGRLDRLIFVPPPDQPARQQILALNLKNVPLDQDVSIEQVSLSTERFSGADMAALCKRVCEKVFIEAIQQGIQREINQADFDSVLAGMRPSISADELKIYNRFAQTGSK
jgi:transitional endoplasmic reticulum ATPase